MTVKRKSASSKRRGDARSGRKGSVGSSFDDLLREDGAYDETQAIALKRVLAWQLEQEMKKQKVTKSEMARRMETSRSQLDRLLDPDIADVKLDTLARAARAVNRRLRLELAA